MRLILGECTYHTAPFNEHIQAITNYEEDDLTTAAIITYLDESLYIHALKDGKFWTILVQDEILGTLEECELALAEYALKEGYTA